MTPILFGSLRQTVVVDCSCSAEYVAASICVKQIMKLENMLEFLEVHCEKPLELTLFDATFLLKTLSWFGAQQNLWWQM